MLWPSMSQWRKWSLPSKLTAIGTLIAAISLSLWALDKTSLFSQLLPSPAPTVAKMPDVAFEFTNSSDDSVLVMTRGDFVLWLPEGVDGGAPRIPGKYDLILGENKPMDSAYVTIAASSSLQVYARLHNISQIMPILDAGSTDLELILRRQGGGIIYSGAIPFTREKVETIRWQLEVGKK